MERFELDRDPQTSRRTREPLGTSSMPSRLLPMLLLLLAVLFAGGSANSIRRASSFVAPTTGSAHSLTLSTYVTDATHLHFATARAGHSPLQAADVKGAAARFAEEGKDNYHASNDFGGIVYARTVNVDGAKKIEERLPGLEPNTSYDVYLVTEVPFSNGVFGSVLSVLGAITNPAAPEVTTTTAKPVNGSATAVTVHIALSSPGIAHVAISPSGRPELQAVTLEDVINSGDSGLGATFVHEKGFRWDALMADIVIDNLLPATVYDVLVVTEAVGDGAVFGQIQRYEESVQTHALAPDITAVSCVARKSSPSQLDISYQLQFPSPEPHRSKLASHSNVAYEVHYEVSSALVLENVRQGSFILADSDKTDDGQPGSGTLRQHTISGLQPDTPYDITFVVETIGSDGVAGQKARVLSCSTHGEAPNILTAIAQPLNSTVDTLQIYVELEGVGNVHYFLVASARAGPLRQSFIQARTASDIRNLVTSTIENEPPSSFREGVIRVQRESETTNTTVATKFDVGGLNDNEAYAIALIAETIGSFGVYGPPFQHIVEASTNENASEVSLLEVKPSPGSTSSIVISLSMTKPADVLHLCTKANQESHEDCCEVERDRLVPIPHTASNFSITVTNLAEDTLYEVKVFAENSKRNGVYSKLPKSTNVRTHRAAPQVLSIHANPIDASVDAVMVQAETSEPGVIYYVAMPQTESIAQDRAAVDEVMTPTQISQFALEDETIKSGRISNHRIHEPHGRELYDHRGHMHRHHGKQQFAGSVSFTHEAHKRCGYAVMNHTSISLSVDGLSANTTYDIYVVTEALSVDRTHGQTRVYGTRSVIHASTHDIAPTIVKSTASAVPHRTDSIAITANISRPGIVHYHLTNIDFADPAFIRGGKLSSPEVRRGSFVVGHQDMGMEILNGTNETTPMEPLVFASNITVDGLTDSTTYHVSLTTETHSSNGVYGEFPAPLLVTTHSPPPKFVDGSLRVTPTPGSSTSISVNFQLNQLGEVHYALFFRGLVQDRCPPLQGELDERPQNETDRNCDGDCEKETAHYMHWPPAQSTFDLTSLTADVLKNARIDVLGGGVWENGTISVSREDILKLKHTEKVIDKLPPNAMFDLCLVPETAGSDGIFANVSCHHVATHADYTNQSRMFDAFAISPVDGTTDRLHIQLHISKLLRVSQRVDSMGESAQERLEDLTGRIPYFILIDGRNGRSELSHNPIGSKSSTRRNRHRDESPFKLAVPGSAHVVAADKLTGITRENDSHLVVEHIIDGLEGNHPYFFFFAYETAHSNGVFTAVNPHRYQSAQDTTKASRHERSIAAPIEVKTHEPAPNVVQLEATPTYGNTSRITVKAEISCESCAEAIVHLVIANQGCEPPETKDLTEVMTAQTLQASELGDSCAFPLVHKRIVVNMTDHNHHSSRHRHSGRSQLQSGVEDDIQDNTLLKPNTTYIVYVATETANSKGVVSEAFKSTLVRTHPVAPRFSQVSVQPRKGTTTELLLRFGLDQPGEIHYVLGKSGNSEFNVTSPYNISAKSLPGVRDSKFHDYGRDVVRARRSVTVEKSGVIHVEVLEYLDAGTAYDIYIVAETAHDSAIYGQIYDFHGVTTYPTPPTLLAHTAFPTPGTVDSLTVGFRVEEGTSCSVHVSVMASQLWGPTSAVAAHSSTFGNRLTMVDHLVARATLPVDANSHETWREVNLSVPYAGSNYTVFLVTETKDSDGVFGAVASHSDVQSHHYPPKLVNASVRAADARVDALAVELTISRSGGAHIDYAVLRHGEMFTRSSISTIGRVDVNGSSLATFVIEGLQGRTTYDVYFRMETLESGGVQSEWTPFPITARTHGLPAEVLESVECNLHPSCGEIGRHPCLEEANICGECLDDFEGIIGSSNVPCQRRGKFQLPAPSVQVSTITISGVRFNPEHTPSLHSHISTTQEAPSGFDEVRTSEDEVSSNPGGLRRDMCPSNARLIAPGQCECDSGYDVDGLGGGCVLRDADARDPTQALGMELASHIV